MRQSGSVVVGSLLVLLLVSGCQSHADGIKFICDAPKNCAECMNATPDMRSTMLARYIEDHLKNDKARQLMKSLAELSAEDRVKAMRDAATEAGLSECAFANALEGMAKADAEPE